MAGAEVTAHDVIAKVSVHCCFYLADEDVIKNTWIILEFSVLAFATCIATSAPVIIDYRHRFVNRGSRSRYLTLGFTCEKT